MAFASGGVEGLTRPQQGLATDDSHHPGYDSGFAWTWVRATELTQAAVLDALRTGRFYGSTGPAIRTVDVSDDEVLVRCSPAASVTLYCGRWRGAVQSSCKAPSLSIVVRPSVWKLRSVIYAAYRREWPIRTAFIGMIRTTRLLW